ncbi:MAG: SMP-30/gluconolactonase/LRE family protein [Pseudomonadota bacterium]
MSGFDVDAAFRVRAKVGEGSIWSARHNALYWVDIPAGKLHRSDPSTGQTQTWAFGRPVGCVAETEDGQIVAALTDGFTLLDPQAGTMTPLGGPKPGEDNHRFNDGTVDPAGRFLAGTMGLDGPTAETAQGRLYAFDGKRAEEVMVGFKTINGLAFSPDGKTAYVSDSNPAIQTIWAYDYDMDDGAWTNKRVFFDCSGIAARPDGGAMDTDGCYWMAGVSGWQLVRITPAGEVDRTVDMPVEKPTRIAFGGPNRDVIYTTSIAVPDDAEQPLSGLVLTVHVPGIQGLDMPLMRFSS